MRTPMLSPSILAFPNEQGVITPPQSTYLQLHAVPLFCSWCKTTYVNLVHRFFVHIRHEGMFFSFFLGLQLLECAPYETFCFSIQRYYYLHNQRYKEL
jgi:hypothetical protein